MSRCLLGEPGEERRSRARQEHKQRREGCDTRRHTQGQAGTSRRLGEERQKKELEEEGGAALGPRVFTPQEVGAH